MLLPVLFLLGEDVIMKSMGALHFSRSGHLKTLLRARIGLHLGHSSKKLNGKDNRIKGKAKQIPG